MTAIGGCYDLQQYNLNITGGSEKIKYFMSAGYQKALGAIDKVSSTKQNLRINVEAIIARNLVAEVKLDMNFRGDESPEQYNPANAGNG